MFSSIVKYFLIFIFIIIFFSNCYIQKTSAACTDSSQTNEIEVVTGPDDSAFTFDNALAVAGKTMSFKGVLKFGKTLVVDGLVSTGGGGGGGSCGGIISNLVICPGSSIIIKNSVLSTAQLYSPPWIDGSADCEAQCEFPPGTTADNIPIDTDPRFMVNVSFFNNSIQGFSDGRANAGIVFSSGEHESCTIFNNTRYQFRILNNDIRVVQNSAISITLINAQGKTDPNLIRISALRNTVIQNNRVRLLNATSTACSHQSTTIFAIGSSHIAADRPWNQLPRVVVEGIISFTGNHFVQENRDHLVICDDNSVLGWQMTTFGANPQFLPLRV